MRPSPLSTDVCDLAWGPVTVRVVWTLLHAGVTVRPDLIVDARDHVFYHLPPDAPVHVAEDRAERLTLEFVARAQGQAPAEPYAEDWLTPPSLRWRRRLHASLAPLAAWVLRLHYADRLDLDRVAWRTGEDRLACEAAREGLREVVRRAAADDGVPLDAWPEARLDLLMHRLASLSPDEGPPLQELVDGKHPDLLTRHVTGSRALGLVRRGDLRRDMLVPPPGGGRPVQELTLVALQLDRDGKAHRDTVQAELPGVRVPVGDDVLLIDGLHLQSVHDVLSLAAQVGAPGRQNLRGIVLRGHGRMSRHGVLGPLAEQVELALRAVPWGQIEGMDDLPDVLPAPPSAWPVWTAAVAAAALAFVVARAAAQPLVPPVVHPLVADATPARGGVWVDFDVDDEADLVIVRRERTALATVLSSASPSEKLRFANGDGSYRLHTLGDGLLIASLSEPLPDLERRVASAGQAADPLAALASSLRRDHPRADVWTWSP